MTPRTARSSFGSLIERAPIAATVAMLDTNPDTKPLTSSPSLGPMTRIAT